MSSDFDDFMDETKSATVPTIGGPNWGLRFEKRNANPLVWQLSSLIPIPPYERGSTVVQGNVTVVQLRDVCLKALQMLEKEKLEIMSMLHQYEEFVKKDPTGVVRTIWRVE